MDTVSVDYGFYDGYYSREAVALCKKLFPTPEVFDGRIKKEKPKKEKTDGEKVYRHILATPLVEVLSINILSRPDNGERPTKCEIYGHIRVMDTRISGGGGGEVFSLFHKDEDSPQSINLGDPLLLTPSSRDAVIIPSEYISLDVLLFDRKVNNMVVAKGKLVLDPEGEKCEERPFIEVNGEEKCTFARVNYIIFQYAVAATIDVLFFSKDNNFDVLSDDDDDDDSGDGYDDDEEKPDQIDLIDYNDSRYSRYCGDGIVADVSGSVTVRSNVNNGNGENYPWISLSNQLEKGVEVKSGDFIPLSRSVVAVPAYVSSLVVDVDLLDSHTKKPIACGILEFKPQHQYTYKKDIVGEHGRVRVRVTWNHAYDQQFYRASEKKQACLKPKDIEEHEWEPDQLLEVFSVDVHSKDFQSFSFYGTIDAYGIPMFRKDKGCPQHCPEGGALATVEFPLCSNVSAVSWFSVDLDLKDATTGAQISKGCLVWDDRLIQPWLDRRICSVIRGERGFAAVHYTAFFDGISFIVDIKRYGKHLPGYVYGKIVARYGTYEYSTAYDKKYYQNVLFDKLSEDDGLEQAQACGIVVPLLKPVICLPRNSSLIIEVDLTVSPEPCFDGKFPQGIALLQDTLELKYNGAGESVERLGNETCHIDVYLKPYSL